MNPQRERPRDSSPAAHVTKDLARLRRLEATAAKLVNHPTITESEMGLAHVAQNVAKRALLVETGRAPVDAGLWTALWELGQKIETLDLQLSTEKPAQAIHSTSTFAQTVWHAEKRPERGRWKEAA